MATTLYGRAGELRQLDDLLIGVLAGIAACAFVEGEAGIGKSAVLEVAADEARARGFRVFRARAEELEHNRPFRSLARALGCNRSAEDQRRREIAEFLRGGSATEDVFDRLLDAFEDLVEAEAVRAPVLLAIDDMQWADDATIQALGAIRRHAARLPLALIGSLRPSPRGAALDAFLRMGPDAARILRLQPIDDDAIVDLARARLGAEPGPTLRAHLGVAGGNPFYLNELLDAVAGEVSLDPTKTVDVEEQGVPPSLLVTILQRLRTLPDDVRVVLRDAAVLGSSFRLEHLAIAAGLAPREAEAAARTLRAHNVISDDGDRLRFRHDLIREAVYADLGEPVRTSAHRRIGLALAEAGASPLEVSDHLVRGATPGDEEVADMLVRASEDHTAETPTTVALIERALEVHPRHPRRFHLVRRLLAPLLTQGRQDEAIERLQRAIGAATDPVDRLELTVALCNATFAARRQDEMRSYIAQATALAEAVRDDERPTVARSAAYAMFFAGRHEDALALTERAVQASQGMGDRVEAEANNQSSWLATLLYQSALALERSSTALALPASNGTRSIYWRHHAWALGDLDRIEEAESALATARRLAEDAAQPMTVMSILSEAAHLRYAVGRWDEAAIDAEAAAAIADEIGAAGDGSDSVAIWAWIAYRRADAGAIERVRLDDQAHSVLQATLAVVLGLERGDQTRARDHLRWTVDRIMGAGPRGRRDCDALPILARAALAVGDLDSAARARDAAAEMHAGSGAPGPALADARCRALVDRDRRAAEAAVALARSSARPVLAAEALEDAAEVPGLPAVDLLVEALGVYDGVGAVRDRRRVAARLKKLGRDTHAEPARVRARAG